ncbi:hypothetical protein RQP46_002970 [Phenoliferia psychrophenolica]
MHQLPYQSSTAIETSYSNSTGPPTPALTGDSSPTSPISRASSIVSISGESPRINHLPAGSFGTLESESFNFPSLHYNARAGSLSYPTVAGAGASLGQPFPYDSRKRTFSHEDEHRITMESYALYPSPAISPTGRPTGSVYGQEAQARHIAPIPLHGISQHSSYQSQGFQQMGLPRSFPVAPYPVPSHAHGLANFAPIVGSAVHHSTSHSQPQSPSATYGQEIHYTLPYPSPSTTQASPKRRRVSAGTGAAARSSPDHGPTSLNFDDGPAPVGNGASLSHLLGPPRTPGPSNLTLAPFLEPAAPLGAQEDDLAPKIEPDYPGDSSAIALIHRSPPVVDFHCDDSCKPHVQKIRFEEDHYTPKWIRKTGHAREGWCAICPGEGKWLQMKNSAFWYHRQFQHGISSVSGHYFLPPVQTRTTASGDKTEGQCHSCGSWVAYHDHRRANSSSPYKGPSLWFRHSANCHSYYSPSREAARASRMRANQGGAGRRP